MAHQVGAVHQLLRAAFAQHHAVGGERRLCLCLLVTGAQAVLRNRMVARVSRAGLGKVGEVGIDPRDVRLVLQVVALDLCVDAAHRLLVFQRGAVVSSLLAHGFGLVASEQVFPFGGKLVGGKLPVCLVLVVGVVQPRLPVAHDLLVAKVEAVGFCLAVGAEGGCQVTEALHAEAKGGEIH